MALGISSQSPVEATLKGPSRRPVTGSVYAGLGVYDTMQYVSPDVATICIGMAASMGCVLLAAGTKGKRAALKHARIMMHQPSGAIGGQATDIEVTVKEIRKIMREM